MFAPKSARRTAVIATAVALMAAAAFEVQAAGKQDFAVVNATGYVISELYVSPSNTTDWQEDILGKDVLAEDDRTDIEFERSEDTCQWDLKVVYADDDSSAQWSSLDLCTISVVTLKYNRATDTTSATIE